MAYNQSDAISSPKFATGTPDWIKPIIESAANKYGISSVWLSALIKAESGFNPNAVSPAGAQGVSQFMPATAQGRGVNPWDPESAVNGTAKYLAEGLQKYGGDIKKATAAYNAGFGAVDRFDSVPPYPETQNYVKRVLAEVDDPHASANGPYLSLLDDLKKQSEKATRPGQGNSPQAKQSPQSPQAQQTPQTPIVQQMMAPPPIQAAPPPASLPFSTSPMGGVPPAPSFPQSSQSNFNPQPSSQTSQGVPPPPPIENGY